MFFICLISLSTVPTFNSVLEGERQTEQDLPACLWSVSLGWVNGALMPRQAHPTVLFKGTAPIVDFDRVEAIAPYTEATT